MTIGPGGFTGLRVGVAAARALALATGLPVVGMSSLAVMAERALQLMCDSRGGKALVVAVDARRGALYVQVFGDNSGDASSAPLLMTVNEAVAALPSGAVVVVGSGGPMIVEASGRADVESALSSLQPHARQLTLLAPVLPVLDHVVPLYLRAADAKPSTAQPLSRRPGS